MSEKLNYDQSLARVEQIVRELEQSEAISIDDYKQKAQEANRLLDQCEAEIREISKDLKV